MARVEFSALVNNIKGKLNGSAFQGSSTGTVVRNIAHPVYRSSPYQSEVRVYNGALKKAWQSMTNTQRNQWAAWRSWYSTSYSTGVPMPITPYNVFRKCNYYRVASGASIETEPSYTPIINAPLFYVGQESLSSVSLEFDRSIVTESEGVVVKASPLLPPTKKSGWSQCRVIPEIIISGNTIDLEIGYVARFGKTPVGGERILIQFLTYDLANGIPYKYQKVLFTVE